MRVRYQAEKPNVSMDLSDPQTADLPLHTESKRGDVAAGRSPLIRRHPRFRNPPVPTAAIADYRHAFRNGDERFLHPAPLPPPGL